ncbi:MAG: HAD-IIB family hydrolase [Deltaproteobacteria bacterium]|nr:HAD-IIB family hydrolase [Deltaproteobacteria bacterium]
MKPIAQFPDHLKPQVRYVLTDIDDTLTIDGQITSVAFKAMERLKKSGIHVFPITGRPAGWCDHIARMWPVDGVVGENGAFYFRYDRKLKKMKRRYLKPAQERKKDRKRLEKIGSKILEKILGCRVASDQAYRETDLAIDYCEDVPELPMKKVEQIVRCFKQAGAQAKVSSIHVNGWFGDHDKLTTTLLLFKEVFNVNLDEIKNQVIFTGDSPNDSPMFAYFPHAVGVADILRFKGKMEYEPAWVTKRKGGYGFAEMVDILLR